MKKCTWCGKEYPDTAERCAIDGEPLTGGAPQETQEGERAHTMREPFFPARHARYSAVGAGWHPTLIHLDEVEGAFEFREGYSRPDWQIIGEAIKKSVPPDRVSEGWTEAAMQWARRVGSELGEAYSTRWSRDFILLSDLEPAAADEFLAFAEGVLERIYGLLQDAAWRTGLGKHVIFLFAEDDDYYQYVSDFYGDGIHPASGGCLLHRGYVHIAIPYLDGRNVRLALAHEIMHNCVVHLRLPLWLNEGLARIFERTIAQGRQTILDHELRDRHLAFWNAENIQKFWSGVSFGEPGDSNELSYSLAEIIVNLLLGQSGNFGEFVMHADWYDAGQTAALDVFGSDLGQTAGTFLGEGNWRPRRKAMVECWEAAKKEEQGAP
jgi:hypothetical protein